MRVCSVTSEVLIIFANNRRAICNKPTTVFPSYVKIAKIVCVKKVHSKLEYTSPKMFKLSLGKYVFGV